MKEKFGLDGGNSLGFPLRTRRANGMPGATNRSLQYEDDIYLGNLRSRCEFLAHRLEPLNIEVHDITLFEAAAESNAIRTDSTSARQEFIVPRGGYLVSAEFIAEDALATSDTNYITFGITNKTAANSGSTAVLAATAPNTTQATGGAAIAANVARSLTLHATVANRNVATGDVLVIAATTTLATALANDVECPRVRIRIATVPKSLTPRYVRTATSPRVGPVEGTANGPMILTLAATNEVQVAGVDLGDEVIIPGTKEAIFSCWITPGTITTAQRMVVGLASAFSSTLDNVALNAWFRLEASMALLAETDDATTDRDDQSCSKTLVAATAYLLRIDLRNTAAVKFYVDEKRVLTLAMAALAATPLQPVLYLQKDSGTGVPSVTFEYLRASWNRF